MKSKKILCFDLDNVICKTTKNYYKKSKPIRKVVKYINYLYEKGYTIKIYTARYMGRNKDNSKLIKASQKNFTKKQLKKWGVKYNKIFFGKPSFDILFDDKSYNFNFKWAKKNFLNNF
jgi:hypothetical protein